MKLDLLDYLFAESGLNDDILGLRCRVFRIRSELVSRMPYFKKDHCHVSEQSGRYRRVVERSGRVDSVVSGDGDPSTIISNLTSGL